MKTKKLILILPFLFLIITPLTFASAECSWGTITTQSTYSMPGAAPVTSISGGCSTQQSKSLDSLCSNIVKPTFSTNSNQSSVCCCTGAAPIAPKKPLFVMPVPEIKIPTVELTEVNCDLNPQTNNYVCAVPWIGEYINGIYKYGINIAGILAALVLMGGGLLWLISGGDASKITQAKNLIIGSITGLVILMCSYILLTQINPDLIQMKSISLGYIAKDITPPPGNTAEFAASCKSTTTGECAISNMSGFGARVSEASAICMAESGGNAGIFNKLTKCTGGEYAVWGLFQFTLSANPFIDENNNTLNCPKAFDKTWTNSSPTCTVIDKTLYDACVKASTNPKLSILNAQKLVTASSGWGPWEANSKWCSF
jgi:hypothetical protein